MVIWYSNHRKNHKQPKGDRMSEWVLYSRTLKKVRKGEPKGDAGKGILSSENNKKSLRLQEADTPRKTQKPQTHTTGHTGLANTKPQPPTLIWETLTHMERQEDSHKS